MRISRRNNGKDRQRETVNVVAEWLAHETASVMVDWNKETSSVMDRLAHRATSVMVFLYSED